MKIEQIAKCTTGLGIPSADLDTMHNTYGGDLYLTNCTRLSALTECSLHLRRQY